MSDPVEETFDDFVALGRDAAGERPLSRRRPLLQIAGLRLLQWQSSPHALISAEVVPFRPHRGILLIVEEPKDGRSNDWLQWLHAEHYPALLATPGTAGAWTFGSSTGWSIYPVDGEPTINTSPSFTSTATHSPTTDALAPLIEERWRSARYDPYSPVRCGP